MTNLRKLSLTAAASVVALGFSAASANVVVTDEDRNPMGITVDGVAGSFIDAGTLEAGEARNINDDDLDDMEEIDELIQFVIGEGVGAAPTAFDVTFPQGMDATVPGEAGILNFTADLIVNDTIVETLNITNAAGRFNFDESTFSFAGLQVGDVVGIALSGTAYEMLGADAAYSISVNADAVPVPAAGLLFGTAALAGAAARRKRKAA